MNNKKKPCRGTTSKTKGFGCGTLQYKRTYGLGDCCLRIWATTDPAGKEWLKEQTAYKMKKRAADQVKKKKQEWIKKKREFNTSSGMDLADRYFSRYIRLKHSYNGKCTCYTCGADKPIKEVDNGHYQKREHKATRYHENNCRPQCKTCNGDIKHNGKQDEFRVHLVNEIGEENVSEIERLAKTTIKANHVFYRETADYYRNKVNEIQKLLKVKYF